MLVSAWSPELKPETKLGVVLFQLGGPDSPEAVEPFLYNLFRDPDIIDFPFAAIAREPLARLVASRRARKVAAHYAALGGGSPLQRFTLLQALALEAELSKRRDARVVVAMRYWHPLTEEAIRQLDGESCQELVLLPLYPQYSKTTTGSSLNEWARKYKTNHIPVKTIREFHSYPPFIDAVVERVNGALERFAEGQVHLVFSAHGVPTSVIEAGDPYCRQVEATTRLVMERGRWRYPHRLCYQSKVGPGRWLEPSLRATLKELGAAGVRSVLVIPISFVSDHIETLQEVDVEAREYAGQVGIRQFEMMPGLNDSPRFVAALAGLVLEAIGEKRNATEAQRHREE